MEKVRQTIGLKEIDIKCIVTTKDANGIISMYIGREHMNELIEKYNVDMSVCKLYHGRLELRRVSSTNIRNFIFVGDYSYGALWQCEEDPKVKLILL